MGSGSDSLLSALIWFQALYLSVIFSFYSIFKVYRGLILRINSEQGEEYKLMWKETVDFVRMASRLNAIIVPFGILGADDAYVDLSTLSSFNAITGNFWL